ncbi:5-formyltetrahydrofolate cyclo-ligase [Paenibacillus wynnii]|uniref:5-formyltetrahydrofolate cyclo-ligase n=1 Tax=Paenibacillus wynnii TaxID=268407 RepID=UPI00278F853F|nr:5-formyltetrahydrofolate cyclo-ligase [Paenibacillus wynnii]MDQ0194020.1 5-formyltetrahydrofolate cyclo-ligase [Paenibacillus wynnii]
MSGHDVILAEEKQVLRRQMAVARDTVSPDQREYLSSLVCGHAWNFLQMNNATSLMTYVAFRSELDTRPIIGKAWEEQWEVYLPRVLPGSGTMAVHRVRSWSELAPGAFGIPEPIVPEETDSTLSSLPAIVFVPGLAFDKRGGRLGYGRGYYDRLRATWESVTLDSEIPPIWIGLAYSIQLVDKVPMDIHDAFMDFLITEDGILDCRKEN